MIIVELFAGVGGFRLGLEGYKPEGTSRYYSLDEGFMANSQKKPISNPEYFITGFANQFEPSTKKKQHAALVYKLRFGDNALVNEDIDSIDVKTILDRINSNVPDERLNEDLILVGGFPCQDYSVAGRLDLSKGMQGKKGVLWWNIFNILLDLRSAKRLPKIVLLENVDRLIKSPARARGKDFMTLLHCLHYLEYDIEYMVINAGDYGYPQRRKRVFIVAHQRPIQLNTRILRDAFPFRDKSEPEKFELFVKNSTGEDLNKAIENYNNDWNFKKSPFKNYGLIKNGILTTHNFEPIRLKKEVNASDILQRKSDGKIDEMFFITELELKRWENAKKAEQIQRIGLNRETGQRDFEYNFSVGKMSTFDSLNKPFRTIITSEGGKSPSRTKHLIKVQDSKGGIYETGMRRLTPLELERANCFPDNFTSHPELTDSKRAFLMGNALVIGVVERIRDSIIRNINL